MARSRTLGVLNIAGEVLITTGVVVLLYLAWQLWINNAVVTSEQQAVVNQNTSAWGAVNSSTDASDTWPAPAMSKVSAGAVIGNLYVPRLGASSTRAVGESVTPTLTLNHGYFGHYSSSQMPGQPGNFALAVHRSGWGTGFKQGQLVRTGDRIYLATKSGYYGYTVRNIEYVKPTSVDVLNAVPGTTKTAGQSLLTITTCSPQDGNAERLVVYAVLDSYRTHAAGPSADLAKLIVKA